MATTHLDKIAILWLQIISPWRQNQPVLTRTSLLIQELVCIYFIHEPIYIIETSLSIWNWFRIWHTYENQPVLKGSSQCTYVSNDLIYTGSSMS